MGEVRAGRDLRLDRDVAIKFLNPEVAARAKIVRDGIFNPGLRAVAPEALFDQGFARSCKDLRLERVGSVRPGGPVGPLPRHDECGSLAGTSVGLSRREASAWPDSTGGRH